MERGHEIIPRTCYMQPLCEGRDRSDREVDFEQKQLTCHDLRPLCQKEELDGQLFQCITQEDCNKKEVPLSGKHVRSGLVRSSACICRRGTSSRIGPADAKMKLSSSRLSYSAYHRPRASGLRVRDRVTCSVFRQRRRAHEGRRTEASVKLLERRDAGNRETGPRGMREELYSSSGKCRDAQTLFSCGGGGQHSQTRHRCVQRKVGHRPRRSLTSQKVPRGTLQVLKPLKMAAVQALPKDVSKLGQEVKLFGKWDTQECVLSISKRRSRNHLTKCATFLPSYGQCRGQGHLPHGLHPNPPCRLPPPHGWPLLEEAVQEGADAHR